MMKIGMFAIVLLALSTPVAALTQTVAFETECLDLDTGELIGFCLDPSAQPESGAVWDVVIGYHADRAVHAVLAPNLLAEVEIAHLTGRTFEEVSAADVEGASFVRTVIDEPFDATRVILVRTDTGAVYKIGRPSETDEEATFDFELLVPAP